MNFHCVKIMMNVINHLTWSRTKCKLVLVLSIFLEWLSMDHRDQCCQPQIRSELESSMGCFPDSVKKSMEFPEFLVKWFALLIFNSLLIFWKLSLKISEPPIFVSEFSELLFERKALNHYLNYSWSSNGVFTPKWVHLPAKEMTYDWHLVSVTSVKRDKLRKKTISFLPEPSWRSLVTAKLKSRR